MTANLSIVRMVVGVALAAGCCLAAQAATAPAYDFVALQCVHGKTGGVVALRDTNEDGRFEIREAFGTFQPFDGDTPSARFENFAGGLAGKDPLVSPTDAAARAGGVAEAPDGSLYMTDSRHGKIWREFDRGKQ